MMENVTNNNNLLTNLPEERGWEYKQITVTRVPGYGFGIAVSGGRDNPHFASGDPSIAVSDVLASGPAERILQVNDRIITVNGISLQNVDYATAVQVLRDSGDTVNLLVKRRMPQFHHNHHHHHQHSASFTGSPLTSLNNINSLPPKVTLTKNSKKEDFGIVLGCKLFIKEISAKARDHLLSTNQTLAEGDFVTKLNNTNCNDLMSLKEAKKIIDGSKEKLQITVARDYLAPSNSSHQAQSSISTTGDDFLTSGQCYSNQNLYVQPPTRNPNLMMNASNGFDEKLDATMSGPNSLMPDDKSNLAPRGGGGRARGPLSDANLSQLDQRTNAATGSYGRSKARDEPPRPPPPRPEDFYSSRRQLYDDDPIIQKTKQPIPDARFITFHKEGSVGIRLTGGNFVGIFVTAVQPGSPASLQGLQPGDKILKVNDMDMTGVTREEAVLFLLSLQDRIELIVQFCKEEYDGIVASQKGDSFYIKTHFHYDNPAKGEMTFRSGDIFHVIDTLYNGVVGCWQVFRIGRNNQEVQKGIIPNKARAEELATAQFNATKKEMSANESRGSFFRRRRSSNRRSKSLGKEHWDDILFSDTVSKFPAYERVVLKHPAFTRPVILFGPIADMAREKLLKDFPDKFISPQLDNTVEDAKSQKSSSNIIRLSAIREVISTGKHALLDITPNAVERLNYAQLYPIVVFFKTETKIIIKQLRQGLPKSAHKSSKKLLEQCQKLDKVWSHVFSATITLNDNTDNWYRKVREIIDKQQSGALWMSENKPEESLSDDFLFPMSSLRLSYASSPESDLEHSPGPPNSPGLTPSSSSVNPGRLTKASSDPSVVMPESSSNDVLPPYQPTYDTRYGFNPNANDAMRMSPTDLSSGPSNNINKEPDYLAQATSNPDISESGLLDPQSQYNNSKNGIYSHAKTPYDKNDYSGDKGQFVNNNSDGRMDYGKSGSSHKRHASVLHGHFNNNSVNNGGKSGNEQSPHRDANRETLYGTAPDLPPRVDRAVKPMAGLLTTAPTKTSNGRSAHERLFGTAKPMANDSEAGMGSLERGQKSKSDSLSSYDSFNNQNTATTSSSNSNNNKQQQHHHHHHASSRIIPNAHDDLKTTLSKIDPVAANSSAQSSPSKYNNNNNNNRWDQMGNNNSSNHHRHDRLGSRLDLKYGPAGNAMVMMDHGNMDHHSSPRSSREMENRDIGGGGVGMDQLLHHQRMADRQDIYRSPAKGSIPKQHIETKTDYGKYSRNNSSAQDYARSSHQDLTQSHLSVHQMTTSSTATSGSSAMTAVHHHSPMRNAPMHANGYDQVPMMGGHHGQTNGHQGGNAYKPIPPPKPKNYKPPYNNNNNNNNGNSKNQPGYAVSEGIMQPPLPYQHGKSHSNPVDQRSPSMSANHNYYYNMPQSTSNNNNNTWHTETAVLRYNSGAYDMAPPYDASRRHHPGISYASRSEIAPISQLNENPYSMTTSDGADLMMMENRPMERSNNIVDLQGSREQRGSAFELYRKPVHHNLRCTDNAFGSQPNIANNTSPLANATNRDKPTKKLTKTQSFKHQKPESLVGTPSFLRRFSFKRSKKDATPSKPSKGGDVNRNQESSVVIDSREYLGVTLEVPENAIADDVRQELYFAVSEQRQNVSPLNLDSSMNRARYSGRAYH